MANALLMAMLDRREDLSHNLRGLFLSKVLSFRDMEEELPALAEFCYQETNPGSLPGLIELYDVWVVQGFQDLHFVLEVFVIFDSCLLYCLHCNSFA